ncbi:hypothetical protein ACWGF3_40500, partial [Streptomyces xanthophaeus]
PLWVPGPARCCRAATLPGHRRERQKRPADPQDVAAVAGSTSDTPACLPVLQAMTWTPIGKPVGTARLVSAAKPKPAVEKATEEDKARAAETALGTTFTAVTAAQADKLG